MVHAKLAEFRGGSLRAWIFAIALRVASDYRKRAFVRREATGDEIPEVSVRMFLRPCSAGAPPPDERRKPGRLASARPFGWIEHTQLTRRCRNWRLQVGRHPALSFSFSSVL